MSAISNRRELLSGFGAGAIGGAIAAAAPQAAEAAAPTARGTWIITPATARGPAPFRAIASFAAGGVMITTGSDEAGTGLGQWSQSGASGFAFTYLNFHFDSAGKLANTVKVSGRGRFGGSRLSGRATLSTLRPDGSKRSPDARFRFTGRRLAIETP
jgi:hypothetical protein